MSDGSRRFYAITGDNRLRWSIVFAGKEQSAVILRVLKVAELDSTQLKRLVAIAEDGLWRVRRGELIDEDAAVDLVLFNPRAKVTYHASVRNGHLVLDSHSSIENGTEVLLVPINNDFLDDDQRTALRKKLTEY